MNDNKRGEQESGKRVADGHATLIRRWTWLLGMALAGLSVLATVPTASADTVFSVSGSFANGAAFEPGSTVTIDTVLGILTDSSLQISAGSNPSPANAFTSANITQNGAFMTPFIWDLADGTDLAFFVTVPPDFQGFTGGTINLVTYFNPVWGFSGGSTNTVLTPVQAPEPTSSSLLVIGLLGLLGLAMWRKRFHGSAAYVFLLP